MLFLCNTRFEQSLREPTKICLSIQVRESIRKRQLWLCEVHLNAEGCEVQRNAEGRRKEFSFLRKTPFLEVSERNAPRLVKSS